MYDIKEDIAEVRKDVKSIKDDINDIKTSIAVNTLSLQHHIKRTDLSEQRLGKIESWTLGLLTAILLAVIAAATKAWL